MCPLIVNFGIAKAGFYTSQMSFHMPVLQQRPVGNYEYFS